MTDLIMLFNSELLNDTMENIFRAVRTEQVATLRFPRMIL